MSILALSVKMFGFTRRRMKLGRLKVYLGDPLQGTRSPARATKRLNAMQGESAVLPSGSGRSDDVDFQCPSGGAGFELNSCGVGNPESWMALSTDGDLPAPRFNHAAAVIGSKMVVVGGESGSGILSDTMILSLDKLTWCAAVPRSPSSLSSKIPACKGHCLVAWGKMVLLVGGITDPLGDRVSVWSFNIETNCWSHVEAKGDIPAVRSGHSVTRAGSHLILFGGEDAKGKKLNDLYMFDLKTSTWLPLHYRGTGPSPRSYHVATIHDDKILLVFGGQSKSRILNDLFSFDFETIVWSRVKIRGHHPSPRAGCSGALCGTNWYIVGGGSKKKRYVETLVFDVVKSECSQSVTSSSASITTNRGFSLVPVQYQDKVFLVAFGGNKKDPSNQVEILMITTSEHSMSWRSAPDIEPLSFETCPASTKELGAHLYSDAPPRSVNHVGRHNRVSAAEHHTTSRNSLSDSFNDRNPLSDGGSLRKQFRHDEDFNLVANVHKNIEDDKYKEEDDCSVMDQRCKQQETTVQVDIVGILASSDELTLCQKQAHDDHSPDSGYTAPSDTDDRIVPLTDPSNIYQFYETKIATLTQKNLLLEGQLKAALASHESSERTLSSLIKNKQDMERKFTDTTKEIELLKEKLAGMEIAQEETNSLSNMVHSDNLRLEHEVAFLKAVLDDTQKELQSTRGLLAGEKGRAFQLQVEVNQYKERWHSMLNRAPTPRKPFHM